MGKTLGRPVVRFNRGRPPPQSTSVAKPVRTSVTPLVPIDWTGAEETFDAQDIYELAVRRAGQLSRLVEVTGGKGRSSCFLVDRARARGEIKVSVFHTSSSTLGEFRANLQRAGALSSVDLRTHAADGAPGFGDLSLSFVFLDVEVGSIERELTAWWSKVERGGMLAGGGYEAVRGAVDAFVAKLGLGPSFRLHKGSWMLHKPLSVDAMCCINLPGRADRRVAVEAQFRSAGIADNVEFFDAIPGEQVEHPHVISNEQAGCVASHLAAIGRARQNGAKNVLIFEDDVQLVDDFTTRFAAALSQCPGSYDVLYVGAICVPKWGNYLHGFDDRLARAGRVGGSHAYMINTSIEPRMRSDLASMRSWYGEHLMRRVQPERRSFVCVPYLAMPARGAQAEDFSQYVYR